MTEVQSRTLEFIRTYTRLHGFSPSYVEIMEAIGLRAVSAICRIVNSLVERGYLRREGGKARSLVVVEAEAKSLSVEIARLKAIYGADAVHAEAIR